MIFCYCTPTYQYILNVFFNMTKILVKANDNKYTFISSFQEKIAERNTGFPELVDVICTYGTYVIRICMNGMSSEFFLLL